jgi:mannose-P-dolichol utilization defect protein 1
MEAAVDSLRGIVQPIAKSLPVPIANGLESLLGKECYHLLILDFVPLSAPACVKLAISKALGLAIVGASSIVKLPQLFALLRSRSAKGVSFLSYALETTSYVVTLAYNARHGFPFSTYGESALIAAQNVAIAAALLHFSGNSKGAAVWVAGVAAVGAALFDKRVVPEGMMSMLQAGAGVLGVASKVPQIYTIWQQGGTGVLSAFAVFNFLLGSLTRIFTTLQEVNDPLILYGFIAGFALNAVLAAQMVYYWNTPASHTAAIEDKKALKGEVPVGSSSDRAKPPTTRRKA